jgi:hypothetical protein
VAFSSFHNEAGRLQLTKCCIDSLNHLCMCSFRLPKIEVKQIDKYRKHCLWRGSNINSKKPPKAFPAVPQYIFLSHKTIVLETAMLFSCSSSSPIPLRFLVATNSLISPQKKGEIQLPQHHVTILTTIFQPYFLLHSCKTHLPYGY